MNSDFQDKLQLQIYQKRQQEQKKKQYLSERENLNNRSVASRPRHQNNYLPPSSKKNGKPSFLSYLSNIFINLVQFEEQAKQKVLAEMASKSKWGFIRPHSSQQIADGQYPQQTNQSYPITTLNDDLAVGAELHDMYFASSQPRSNSNEDRSFNNNQAAFIQYEASSGEEVHSQLLLH